MRTRKRRSRAVHPRGILERVIERLRGREQILVRGGEDLPLLLLSFPRGSLPVAREIETACTHTLSRLRPQTRAAYRAVFASLPTLIVVLLRPSNPCGCLGHHHPRGAESRLTKRLASDLGSSVAEIDLAYQDIHEWRPQPISSLAAAELGERLVSIHFQAAVLAVLLHELEHLALPNNPEQEIRARSNCFYATAMQELVAEESGAGYGMASPPPRP